MSESLDTMNVDRSVTNEPEQCENIVTVDTQMCPRPEVSRELEQVSTKKVRQIQFIIVCAVLLVDSMSTTMLFSYVGLLVAHIDTSYNRSTAGYASGVLVGLFQGAQIFTLPFWGGLSDKVGRKPVLLTSLFLSMAVALSFGLASRLWLAFALRFCHGLIVAGAITVKSYVTEITDESNAAKAFSMMALARSFGSFVGPAVGGLLYDPIVNRNRLALTLFGESNTFLRDYPAFLPAVVLALYAFVVAVLVFFFMEETNEGATPMGAYIIHRLTRRIQVLLRCIKSIPKWLCAKTHYCVGEADFHNIVPDSDEADARDEMETLRERKRCCRGANKNSDNNSSGLTPNTAIQSSCRDESKVPDDTKEVDGVQGSSSKERRQTLSEGGEEMQPIQNCFKNANACKGGAMERRHYHAMLSAARPTPIVVGSHSIGKTDEDDEQHANVSVSDGTAVFCTPNGGFTMPMGFFGNADNSTAISGGSFLSPACPVALLAASSTVGGDAFGEEERVGGSAADKMSADVPRIIKIGPNRNAKNDHITEQEQEAQAAGTPDRSPHVLKVPNIVGTEEGSEREEEEDVTAADTAAKLHSLALTELREANKILNSKTRLGFVDVWTHPVLRYVIPMYMSLASYNVGTMEVIPLLAIAYRKDGGLELTSAQVGGVLMTGAFAAIVANASFACVASRIALVRLWMVCNFVAFVATLCVPLVSYVGDQYILVLAFMATINLVRTTATTWCFSMYNMMVANVAPKNHLGKVTAVCQSTGSMARCVSPMVSGAILAWSISSPNHVFPFNHFFTFIILAMLAILCLVLSKRVDGELVSKRHR